jgi:hypothetical protein
MRVQIGVSSLSASSNPHYGSGKGATIYRFVSDQFSSFYTKVINTNARDAIHVIDGLLHHESDLMIEEHYTDTAGYTDQVFGLTHLLGFRFAPRLRDLSSSKLYTIGSPKDFSNIEGLIRGQVNMKLIYENYDDVLRIAHSIREGKVSGALIMGKLGSYTRQNKVAKALSTESTVVKAEGSIKNQQASSIVFTDVPKGHWSSQAIQELADSRIIACYGNGIFGFGDNVTREQVAALIYRAFEVEEQDEYENPYGDIVDENSTMFLE